MILLGAQLRPAPLGCRLGGAQLFEPAALFGDFEFGLAQARTQGIALLQLLAEPFGQFVMRERTAASLALACAESGDCSERGESAAAPAHVAASKPARTAVR
jgi:hypothetical protein